MIMTMIEKIILFAFGCPNREITVERLRCAAALATDPAAKKVMFTLAVKLNDKDCDNWYRDFFYNMRLELEHCPHHKYLPNDAPVTVEESVRDYHKRMRDRKGIYNRPMKQCSV